MPVPKVAINSVQHRCWFKSEKPHLVHVVDFSLFPTTNATHGNAHGGQRTCQREKKNELNGFLHHEAAVQVASTWVIALPSRSNISATCMMMSMWVMPSI